MQKSKEILTSSTEKNEKNNFKVQKKRKKMQLETEQTKSTKINSSLGKMSEQKNCFTETRCQVRSKGACTCVTLPRQKEKRKTIGPCGKEVNR